MQQEIAFRRLFGSYFFVLSASLWHFEADKLRQFQNSRVEAVKKEIL
jgi:hypothetical protein